MLHLLTFDSPTKYSYYDYAISACNCLNYLKNKKLDFNVFLCNYISIGGKLDELDLLKAEMEKSKLVIENSLKVVKHMLESEERHIKSIKDGIDDLLKIKKGESL